MLLEKDNYFSLPTGNSVKRQHENFGKSVKPVVMDLEEVS